ncbi:DUF4148 domain-containing protein [Burkholderia cenocepacia]|uniref:DUF4148 domain-containing protein n=1 Tax=Burkholderia cepacia complex TaxID=87882 RepID=UPI000F58C340|nr:MULTISPECIES: DUF4148 domain-containing protein [Burkholderia cepacia complex]ELW9450946.1 DUF4148 domain-containing protein [Burkholderia cenocepacia]MBR8071530.1 DUF4148 domain-containing protein [Burkholderia cenocepacia]MBR8447679.1 DUF4148 domain-containing protein [Burkholderia cenocepacia]MBR8486968.1 DUF4148 domain-containing protein [Burkholderia cenocepacia]MDN7472970.1 DUF4148 domain-containing protein [Burkholderia orbicola]
MNTLIRAALLSCALSAPIVAFAQSADHTVTRADVRADLIQAERDGTLPTSNWDYPPSTQTIARNRELYAIAHGDRPTAMAATSSAAVSTASAQ